MSVSRISFFAGERVDRARRARTLFRMGEYMVVDPNYAGRK